MFLCGTRHSRSTRTGCSRSRASTNRTRSGDPGRVSNDSIRAASAKEELDLQAENLSVREVTAAYQLAAAQEAGEREEAGLRGREPEYMTTDGEITDSELTGGQDDSPPQTPDSYGGGD